MCIAVLYTDTQTHMSIFLSLFLCAYLDLVEHNGAAADRLEGAHGGGHATRHQFL